MNLDLKIFALKTGSLGRNGSEITKPYEASPPSRDGEEVRVITLFIKLPKLHGSNKNSVIEEKLTQKL